MICHLIRHQTSLIDRTLKTILLSTSKYERKKEDKFLKCYSASGSYKILLCQLMLFIYVRFAGSKAFLALTQRDTSNLASFLKQEIAYHLPECPLSQIFTHCDHVCHPHHRFIQSLAYEGTVLPKVFQLFSFFHYYKNILALKNSID